jgi:hypothetical protein
MTRLSLLPACLLAAASVSLPVHAQVGATLDLGSTGVGAHLVLPLSPGLNGRLGINYFKHDFEKRSGQVEYDLDGKLQTVDALLDWYPRAGGNFRVTAGVLYNDTRFDATASPDQLGSFSLNGARYSAADVGLLVGKVDFRKAAPYLGIGWGNALNSERGWRFGGDLGVFYQGSARVSLRSERCALAAALCERLARDVAAEQARLADDASDYKVYPVARASLSYRF